MLDQETWRFINTFAPWLSAIGTIAAVVVSLYLARRSVRTDVRVFAAIMNLISPGQKLADSPEFFQIRAVNHGFREVVIQGIMWQLRGLKSQAYVVIPPVDPYSTKLPVRLQCGEQAQFMFSTTSFRNDAESLLLKLKDSRSVSSATRRLRVGVYSSTGQEFLARLDKRLRRWLVDQAKGVIDRGHG